MTLGLGDLVISHDKLQILHLHYHSAYDHQTWQYGNLSCGATTRKVTQPYTHMVL